MSREKWLDLLDWCTFFELLVRRASEIWMTMERWDTEFEELCTASISMVAVASH